MSLHAVDTDRIVRELRTAENLLTLAEEQHKLLPPEVQGEINRHAGWGERLRLVHSYAGLSLPTLRDIQDVVGQMLTLVGEEPVSSPRRPDLRVIQAQPQLGLWRP